MEPLLDQAPCGFVSLGDDGTILEINTTLATQLGATRIELLGWHVQKLLSPGARVFYQTHLFPLLKMKGRVEEIYLTLRAKDGTDVPMLMHALRRERNGAFVSDCVFVRMQQRFQYESELLEARRAADRANAAKAKFLSMMSHDLRNPLTSISGNAALLAGGMHGPLNEAQADAIARIREACTTQLRMINDILSFAKLESGHVEVAVKPVRVAEAIAQTERLLRERIAEAGHALAVDCAEDVFVHADPDRFQQVLLNLVTNAIKFMPPGGTIAILGERDESNVRIHVRDSGVGIPREQLETVFEPFVQLDPERTESTQRGVGLGLAIARELARAMDGELTAESVVGQGSVFTISLPAAVPVPG
ncbi:MAG TPA: PAS domain-containing sensor histidine kinase [Thermoanaerobaculia bacterium]|nr:PAS domain-containing sensor histidine kinase [Thermoanaerobaculia bacterium]